MVLTVRFEIPAYRTVDHFVDITSCVFQGSARASTNVIIDCQLSTSISTLLLYSLWTCRQTEDVLVQIWKVVCAKTVEAIAGLFSSCSSLVGVIILYKTRMSTDPWEQRWIEYIIILRQKQDAFWTLTPNLDRSIPTWKKSFVRHKQILARISIQTLIFRHARHKQYELNLDAII